MLRSLQLVDAPALYRTISVSRDAFDPWLRWSAAINAESSAETFIAAELEREQRHAGFHLGLWSGANLQGGIPCWSIDSIHQVAELGYWLVPAARGRGLAERSVHVALALLFGRLHVNRVEFQCGVANSPSRRLAERVGGQLEGIRRESHVVAGEYRDHAVYSILAREYAPAQPPGSA
jgi:ribosomal-protein-serine acetyltransferase